MSGRERFVLVHPCGHCGEAEGAGAAGLCQGCAEGGTVCPTCGEEMVDGDEHYTCEAFAALLAPQSCGAVPEAGRTAARDPPARYGVRA